jgi:hypothetical protein
MERTQFFVSRESISQEHIYPTFYEEMCLSEDYIEKQTHGFIMELLFAILDPHICYF